MDVKFDIALRMVHGTLDEMRKAESVKDLDDLACKAATQLGILWCFADFPEIDHAVPQCWTERSEIYTKRLNELMNGVKTPEDKIAELESEIDELKDKNKNLNDMIDELRNYNDNLEDIIKDAKLDALM